jgi:hypothetical protein
MSWLEFAGLEARRRTFTVLFHDLGKEQRDVARRARADRG